MRQLEKKYRNTSGIMSTHNIIYEKYISKTKRSIIFAEKSASHYQLGNHGKRDLYYSFEMAFISIFISFEHFFEETYIAALMKPRDNSGRRLSLVLPASKSHAAEMIKLGNRYFDPFPLDQFKKRSKIFIKDFRPFDEITNADKRIIDECSVIRNHIAHESENTKKRYKTTVIPGKSIPHKSLRPGVLLSSEIYRGVSYIEHYYAEMAGIARKISLNL